MRLYGTNPVIERLRFNPTSIQKIYIQEGNQQALVIRKKAQKSGIPVLMIPSSKMIKIARNINTQGVIIDVTDFEYIPFDDLLEQAANKRRTLVFLDGLNDPQNLGAILRSLACLGNFSVVLPTHDSVGVTEAVLRVASGGDNHVPVAKVANLNQAIKSAKENGYWIAGAVVKDGESLERTKLTFPIGLVIGSEQKGIREVILKQLDIKVTIPMAAPTLTFNAAHAASILCYEITRQKKAGKT